MADKGWTVQTAAAAGIAAGTGAAQLGLGYGLGVVVWPMTMTADDSVWLGSLGWATWIAASSTVLGAVVAARLHRPGPAPTLSPPPDDEFADPPASAPPAPPMPRPSGPWRLALALAAAVGALVTVALIALPARAAVRPDTYAPETIATGYALVGVALGLVIAYWAVGSRPVAANLIATTVWLWALAVAAIIVQLTTDRASETYLTSWQFADLSETARYGTIYWPSALLTVLAALLIGMIAVWPAVVRGDVGLGAATSGAVGPLLVAAAFLALAPRLTGFLGPLGSAYLIAPYAVLAGLAGSALTVTLGRQAADRRRRRAHRAATTRAQTRRRPNTNTMSRAADARPPDARPSDARPSDARPSDARPPEARPADARPSDARPSDARPPVEAGPGQPPAARRALAPRPQPAVPLARPGRTEDADAGTQSSPLPVTPSEPDKKPRRGLFSRRRPAETTAEPTTAPEAATAATPAPIAPMPDSPPVGAQRPPVADEQTPRDRAGVSAAAVTRPTVHSTVAPPPPDPPIAKINPGSVRNEPAAPAKSAPAAPTPAARSTPAKAAPAKATPAKATPAKTTPAKANPASKATKAATKSPRPAKAAPDDSGEKPTAELRPLWVDDTEAAPPPLPRRRAE